ncbi:hypothetical protein SAMD00019534_008310, partial [Acytostelium subglobosum LB1]|uniref:hypothetical protein n=1 Tax=Acytostelium subglobosum LB1 TaxID=1410327 RepID=UPI00064486A3
CVPLLMSTPLPTSLTNLRFGDQFMESITPGILPTTLKTLRLGEMQQLDGFQPGGWLPESLESLRWYIKERRPIIPGLLPEHLAHFHYGGFSNMFIRPGVLPRSLTSLVLGVQFNQPLPAGSLPDSLIKLTMGYSYSQPCKNVVLPPSLETLAVETFNQVVYAERHRTGSIKSMEVIGSIKPGRVVRKRQISIKLDTLSLTRNTYYSPGRSLHQLASSLLFTAPRVATINIRCVMDDLDSIQLRRLGSPSALVIMRRNKKIHGWTDQNDIRVMFIESGLSPPRRRVGPRAIKRSGLLSKTYNHYQYRWIPKLQSIWEEYFFIWIVLILILIKELF